MVFGVTVFMCTYFKMQCDKDGMYKVAVMVFTTVEIMLANLRAERTAEEAMSEIHVSMCFLY